MNDKRKGAGKYFDNQGGEYDGNFENDKFNGKGKYRHFNGETYVG